MERFQVYYVTNNVEGLRQQKLGEMHTILLKVNHYGCVLPLNLHYKRESETSDLYE